MPNARTASFTILKQLVLLFLPIFIHFDAYTQTSNLPVWFTNSFKHSNLDKKYTLSNFLTTSVLQADFNGDSSQDIAVLIVEKATNKKGILLIHNKKNQYFVFGAGKNFGNGSDNFNWADNWSIYKKKIAFETIINKKSGDLIGGKKIKLIRPAMLIESKEIGSGGLIYWNGKKYIWIQQGE